jgi:hypothetical protein
MKNRIYSTVAAILAVLLLSSCTTVPVAYERSKAGEGVYIIRLGSNIKDADAQKYAINQFVKSKGYDSYDFEMTNKPGKGQYYFEFNVTVPGSIPVENMDEVRIIDGERTARAVGITIGVILIAPVIFLGMIFGLALGI